MTFEGLAWLYWRYKIIICKQSWNENRLGKQILAYTKLSLNCPPRIVNWPFAKQGFDFHVYTLQFISLISLPYGRSIFIQNYLAIRTTRMALQLSDMWFLGHRVRSTTFKNLKMSHVHVFTQAKKSAVWKSAGKLESLPFKWLWHGCLGHFVNNVVPPTDLPDHRAFSFLTPFAAVGRAYSQSVTF